MKFSLGNVLGDAKGANVLFSRYNNNTTSHIARDCNVLTLEWDGPECKCVFNKQKDLNQLTSEQLQALSFHKVVQYNP